MKTRQLSDRIEQYKSIQNGRCQCGQPFVKVEGSNCTMWMNGDRFHYPGENTAVCVFRCKECGKPIHENFIPNENSIGHE